MKNKVLASFSRLAAVSILAVSALTLAPQARAEGTSISAVGVFNLSNLNGSLSLGSGTPGAPNGNNVTTGTTLGFGALLDLGSNPGFGLQIGGLYVPRKINYNDASGNSQGGTTIKSLEIPVLLRLNLPVVSIGAGPYYAKALGKGTVSVNGAGDADFDLGTSNIASSDFGLAGSVSVNIPILPSLSVLLDGRYLFGLTNLDTTGATSTHFRDFQLLAGVTVGL